MDAPATTDLKNVARDIAKDIAGEDAVRQVEVVPGERLDRPVYVFSYLFDKDRSRLRPGLVLSRLVQRLGEELSNRGDEHRPVIRLLDQVDWDKHRSA